MFVYQIAVGVLFSFKKLDCNIILLLPDDLDHVAIWSYVM